MRDGEQQVRVNNPVGQAVRALELMSGHEGEYCTIEYLATGMSLPIPSIRRLMRTLLDQGLVAQSPDGNSYFFGPRSVRLSNLIQRNLPLERIARPIMQALVAEFDETVTLNAYLQVEGNSVCLAVEECGKPIQYTLEPGELKYLHSGASGKAILAFLAPESIEHIVDHRGLVSVTSRTLTDRRRLEEDLEQIRRDGVAVSFGERISGAVGIGAPVFGGAGRVVASLTMTIPQIRSTQELIDSAKRAVRRRGHELSTSLASGAEGWEADSSPVSDPKRR